MSNYNNFKHTDLTSAIIKAAYYVFEYHGFGHSESVYENSMKIQIGKVGLNSVLQQPIKVYFEKQVVGDFKADIVVENTVIVELKAVEKLHPKHEVQLVNYLKSTEIEVGLLINFGEEITIKRKVFSNERKRNLNRLP